VHPRGTVMKTPSFCNIGAAIELQGAKNKSSQATDRQSGIFSSLRGGALGALLGFWGQVVVVVVVMETSEEDQCLSPPPFFGAPCCGEAGK
jgi:hypothetical protein